MFLTELTQHFTPFKSDKDWGKIESDLDEIMGHATFEERERAMFDKLAGLFGDDPLVDAVLENFLKPAFDLIKDLLPDYSQPLHKLKDGRHVTVGNTFNHWHCDEEAYSYDPETEADGSKVQPTVRCSYDVWRTIIGFKDGMVKQGGRDSLMYQCDTNLTYWGYLVDDWEDNIREHLGLEVIVDDDEIVQTDDDTLWMKSFKIVNDTL